MNILVTAGPTREYIDPIRFITNSSSGRQGVEIAEEAKRKGHNVILILGPVTVQPPKEIPLVRITTAGEMLKSVIQYKDWMDALIMNAAVGDWKVIGEKSQKIKKTKKTLNLKFIQNPDIIGHIGRLKKQKKTKPGLILVGFSVDTDNFIKNAEKKLKEKNLDIIVANPVDAFGAHATAPVIIDRRGAVTKLPLLTKKDLAKKLIKQIASC